MGLMCFCSGMISLDLSYKRDTYATYNAQSTAMMRVMSSVGNPTDVSTITMVTSPACGIPAAPILAAVAVMLVEICRFDVITEKNPLNKHKH